MNNHSTQKKGDKRFGISSEYWIWALPLILALWLMISYTRFTECSSGSLKSLRYALFVKSSSFAHGDIVYLQGYQAIYIKRAKNLAKRVLGIPGDRIERQTQNLKIIPQNQKSLPTILPLLNKTQKGEPLTPLFLSSIPEGYVFVSGDHLRSFDSRYEEFGLVPIEKIWGKAVFIW